jgi:hypothetical protein
MGSQFSGLDLKRFSPFCLLVILEFVIKYGEEGFVFEIIKGG